MFVYHNYMMVEICNKLYTYLYHHIVVLDMYIHSNLVYYKHNWDDEPYDFCGRYRTLEAALWLGG